MQENAQSFTIEDDYVDYAFSDSASEAVRAALDYRVNLAYGTWEAYEQAKQRAGITEDHARNFERYGVVLQPKQLELAVWARSCDTEDGPTEIGFGGARGPGKSFAYMAQIALDDCQRWPGLKALYLRKTGKAAQEQLSDLVQSVLDYYPDADVSVNKIEFKNGSRILIGGFKDDSQALTYQGIEYDILLIEETTQLTEHTYKTLRLSTRSSKTHKGKRWRARTYTSTNPLGIGHQWYKKRFVDNERRGRPNGRTKFIFATVDDNVFVGPEYVENLDDLTGAEKRAYREGDWDVSAGAYFEEWNEQRHVVPAIDSIPANWSVYASMDYGFNHWNVVQLHAVDHDGVIYTFDELCHRKHYPHEIAPDIKAVLNNYGLRTEDVQAFVVGNDAFRKTGNAEATVADLYAEHDIILTPADMSPGSRVAGAHRMAQLLGNVERDIPPRWYISEKCHRLRDTMPYMERDPNNNEDVLKVNSDENGNGGDDAYDCARYGVVDIAGFTDAIGGMYYAQAANFGSY